MFDLSTLKILKVFLLRTLVALMTFYSQKSPSTPTTLVIAMVTHLTILLHEASKVSAPTMKTTTVMVLKALIYLV